MITTRAEWVKTFMERTNDIAIANSLVSKTPLVDTLTILTNAIHNNQDLAVVIIKSIQAKVEKIHRYDPINSQVLTVVKELAEAVHLMETGK